MDQEKLLFISHLPATGIVRRHKGYLNSGRTYPYPGELQLKTILRCPERIEEEIK